MCSILNCVGCVGEVIEDMISVACDVLLPVGSCCCVSDICCCCWSAIVLESSGCEEAIDDGVTEDGAFVDWVEFSEASPVFEAVVVIGTIDMLGVTVLWMGGVGPPIIDDCCA